MDWTKSRFLSPKETIDFVIKHGKSLIRWGDGETKIVQMKNLYSQKPDENLSSYLKTLLQQYNKGNTNYLLALPYFYLLKSEKELEKIGKLTIWGETCKVLRNYCSDQQVYGDAFVFFPDCPFGPLNNEEISQLWLDAKKIILIHSNKQYYLDFNQRFSKKDVSFVKIPDYNAFQNFTHIFTETINVLETSKTEKKDIRILVSAGPTAKALVFELSRKGYISYDMGHYFDATFYGKGYEAILAEMQRKRRKG